MKTKKCTNKNCKNPIKQISEFSKNKSRKDGLQSQCKKCVKDYQESNKERTTKYQKEYYENNKEKLSNNKKDYYSENKVKILRRQEKFPWKRILGNIKQRCTNLNDTKFYRYGGRGIECLISEDELKKLWFRDEAYLMEHPSIDRKENDGHYEYGNCEFIEKSENSAKDKRKLILQFDLDGKFIKEWDSQAKASRCLNVSQGNISKVASGRLKTAGGFKWEFQTRNSEWGGIK